MQDPRDDIADLEGAMWAIETRGDREWMDAHLTEDFIEYGRSGRVYDKRSTLDTPVGPFRAELIDLRVSLLSDDIALVTYRSSTIFGDAPPANANRSSIWVHDATGWRLRFHQGTPSRDTRRN